MTRIRTFLAVATIVVILASTLAMSRSADANAQAGDNTAPSFIQPNKKYAFRWSPGDTEVYMVLEIRGAWAKARRDTADAKQEGGKALEQWLNLSQAITITDVK
jgi:hypothetical protein